MVSSRGEEVLCEIKNERLQKRRWRWQKRGDGEETDVVKLEGWT